MLKRATSTAQKLLQFLTEYSADLKSFIRHNGYSPMAPRDKRLFYKLIIETHTIEKGLSLESPKPLFGKEKISFIINTLKQYQISHSPFPAQMAIGALRAYLDHHQKAQISDPFLEETSAFVSQYEQGCTAPHAGGIKQYPTPMSDPNPRTELLVTRTSSRMFDGTKLAPEALLRIGKLTQTAPSQCNRQSTHLHIYQDKAKIVELLDLQGGGRGFADRVGNLAVVTSDITAWGGAGQRNQLYVDGALFAMTFIYACHAEGVATCPLNLAITNATERKIKDAGKIPDSERLVVMIAFGNTVAGDLKAAMSPRRDISEILHIHE
ncbi:nitroreductase family protein [Stutzerimonas stutzeri]|uniref:nitroreductase family protein n=1 Tax=Stutzerimonas stutzeri TaxID=316 RepID=UPI003D31A766